jgi:hypothetical protein
MGKRPSLVLVRRTQVVSGVGAASSYFSGTTECSWGLDHLPMDSSGQR